MRCGRLADHPKVGGMLYLCHSRVPLSCSCQSRIPAHPTLVTTVEVTEKAAQIPCACKWPDEVTSVTHPMGWIHLLDPPTRAYKYITITHSSHTPNSLFAASLLT